MAFALGSQGFISNELFISNFEESLGIISVIGREVPAEPGVATAAATQTQSLPAGAIVQSAVYTVTARPAGVVTIGTVAQVREGNGELVVDFQGMRTVDRLQAPVAITSIRPWAGTQFSSRSLISNGSGAVQRFTEVQTERLLVQFSGALGEEDLAANGSVSVLSPPADLELLVNGTRAWFNAGPAKPSGVGRRSDCVRDDRRPDRPRPRRRRGRSPGAESVAVEVVLRSSVPGQLALGAVLDIQPTFGVLFPEGATRTVEAPEEGAYEVALPLPAEAADWQIHEVQATVSATLPLPRVLPPDGPELSADAQLLLDADHAVLVGLPPAGLAPLATLAGIRLPIGVGAEGAELAGVLRADDGGVPGEPVPGGPVRAGHPARGRARPARLDDPAAREGAQAGAGGATLGGAAARARQRQLAARDSRASGDAAGAGGRRAAAPAAAERRVPSALVGGRRADDGGRRPPRRRGARLVARRRRRARGRPGRRRNVGRRAGVHADHGRRSRRGEARAAVDPCR